MTDGRGGWFLRGDISAVGGVEVGKTEIVHLRATGVSTRTGQSARDGEIYAMARVGRAAVRRRVVLHGSTGGAREPGGDRRPLRSAARLAAPGSPGRTKDDLARVYAIAPTSDGSALYIGGDFGRVDGTLRTSLAAFGADGALLSLRRRRGPRRQRGGRGRGTSERLTSSLVDPRGRVLYAAGDFDDARRRRASGARRRRRPDRTRPPWNPDCDGDVWAIEVAPAGSPVYVAGEFASIGGKSRRGLAAVDARLGTATLWDPGVGGAVHTIALDAPRKVVFAGGEFESVGDADRTNLAAVDTRTGSATPWDVPVVGTVDVVGPPARGGVVVGGEIESVGALRRNGLAALTADGVARSPTGSPPIRGIVRALAPDAQPRPGVRRRAVLPRREPHAAEPRDPRPRQRNPGALGADGQLGRLGDRSERRRADRVPRRRVHDGGREGAPAAGRAPAPATAHCCRGTSGRAPSSARSRWSGDELWVGGQFTSIGGEQRRGIAAVEIASAQTQGWDASANGNVESVAVIGETVYVAGPFTAIGGRSRKHLAALDAADGAATRWDPAPDDVVRALGRRLDGTPARRRGRLRARRRRTARCRVVRTRDRARDRLEAGGAVLRARTGVRPRPARCSSQVRARSPSSAGRRCSSDALAAERPPSASAILPRPRAVSSVGRAGDS